MSCATVDLVVTMLQQVVSQYAIYLLGMKKETLHKQRNQKADGKQLDVSSPSRVKRSKKTRRRRTPDTTNEDTKM